MVYPGDPLQGTMAVDDFGLGEVSLNFLYQSIRSGVKMARMNEANVEVEYQYTEAEYLAANRLFLFRTPNVMLRLIVFAIFALMSAVLFSLLFSDLFPLWAGAGIVILFLAALFFNVLVGLPRKYFRGNANFRDKYQITFSDDGLHVRTTQIDSKQSWSLYTKAFEGHDMYLLIYGTDIRMMTMVPKRAFKSADQENLFRAMIKRHITDHSGVKQIASMETEYTPSSLTPPDWR